ncbi:hypothetical protein HPB51_011662 [Rhipicephalus microplus]|uniref:Uncharacterized protein n=1 Tax=Rhipicephalus microplus TaxID=6941 RepID=A0A9J6ESV8_RHIMP|nr:hypothetical protein HPB51_011662 [Rhipicephalus microplus]
MRGLQSRRQRHCPRDLRVTSAVASKGESAKSNTSCLGSFLTRSTRFRYLPEVCDEPVLRAGGLLRGPACRGGDGAGCRGGLRGQLVETRQEMATAAGKWHGGRPRKCSRRSRVFKRRRRGTHPWSRYTGDPTHGARCGTIVCGGAGRQRSPRFGPISWSRRGESGASAPRRDHEHLAFLTPSTQTTTPARDILRLLKTNIDQASKSITDIMLRHTRYGLTVFSNTNDIIQNLVQDDTGERGYARFHLSPRTEQAQPAYQSIVLLVGWAQHRLLLISTETLVLRRSPDSAFAGGGF